MPERVWAHIAVMAAVTYAIRFLPLAVLRRELRHPVLRAFLRRVPYATLAAMTFPDALSATPHLASGAVGLCVAGFLAFRGIGLLPTAAVASFSVALAEAML